MLFTAAATSQPSLQPPFPLSVVNGEGKCQLACMCFKGRQGPAVGRALAILSENRGLNSSSDTSHLYDLGKEYYF